MALAIDPSLQPQAGNPHCTTTEQGVAQAYILGTQEFYTVTELVLSKVNGL